ncbi:hypothetical protein [Mucilaginibacter sp. AK015]|uniref:hypothetical protein n=1 Tax=Mucilaginibacter sp. AK015 TaxID=2723072 RepID=UPI00161B9C44|nr:hypothetical protein [Mucilaginibacter sp. AK015]MBB5395344.1 hypothetical protein [Mucilaginibacter sp. AK015]
MKNLILTVLHHYSYPVVEPFIRSLKATRYDGDLVIFVSASTSKATKRLLAKQGAILIEFSTTYPFNDSYTAVFEDISPEITLNNYRFLFYLKYLQDNPGKYGNVMLTDIRDVVFQKNIFDGIAPDKIYFFLEDASEIFRTSKLNYNWSLLANGPEVTNKMINENVSCAGIVAGSGIHIISYLKYIQTRLKFRADLHWGIDQGLHNAYIYTQANPKAMVIPNTQALVLTLGACSTFKQLANGDIVNGRGEPYHVIHQYDRFGDLLMYFKEKYVGSRLMQKFKKVLFAILP